jgi:hypothetical protein
MHRRTGRLAGIVLIAALTALGGLAAPATAAGNAQPLPPNTVRTDGARQAPGAHGPAFAPVPATAPQATVQSSDYPSVVAILVGYQSNGQHYVEYCTGTVLTPTRVLTAANCEFNYDRASITVLAGDSAIGPTGNGGYADQAVAVWTDADYGAYLELITRGGPHPPSGNVSVLSLATPLPAAYPPIALTAQGDQTPYAAGTKAVMVGYAVDQHGAGYLQATTEPLKSGVVCSANVKYNFDPDTMVCGGQSTGSHYVCDGDQGGPLLINGEEAALVSTGSPDCTEVQSPYVLGEKLATYAGPVLAAAALPAAHDQDATGDGHADLMGRDTSGNLVLYSGSGLAGTGFHDFQTGLADVAPVQLGSGLGQYSAADITRDAHWNGTSTTAVLAVNAGGTLTRWDIAYGALTGPPITVPLYGGLPGVQRLIAVDNWFGPGQDGLLTVRADGSLWAYHGNGAGGLSTAAPVQIGSGWLNSTSVLDAGDFLTDGHTGIISRKPDGSLWLFETTDGQGGWVDAGGQQIATNWNFVVNPIAVGDFNGDDLPDLIGVDPQGTLWQTTTDGKGDWTSVPTTLTTLTGLNLAF